MNGLSAIMVQKNAHNIFSDRNFQHYFPNFRLLSSNEPWVMYIERRKDTDSDLKWKMQRERNRHECNGAYSEHTCHLSETAFLIQTFDTM